jgi:hypothetical protein
LSTTSFNWPLRRAPIAFEPNSAVTAEPRGDPSILFGFSRKGGKNHESYL